MSKIGLVFTALQPLDSWCRVPVGWGGLGGWGGVFVSNPTPFEVDLRLCRVEVGVLTTKSLVVFFYRRRQEPFLNEENY